MPLFIRVFTGLVVGGMFWYAFGGGLLRLIVFGLWGVGVAYVGLVLAAYWEQEASNGK